MRDQQPDIAEAFGLTRLGAQDDGTHHGQAVPSRGDQEAWRDDAACHPRNKPDDMTIADWVGQWFPTRGTTGRDLAALRAICAGCPALEPCRADALGRNDPGFQGGLTEQQRRRIRRRTPRQRNPHDDIVAELVAAGWTDARIAPRVGLTVRGVQSCRRRLGLIKASHGRLVADQEDAA